MRRRPLLPSLASIALATGTPALCFALPAYTVTDLGTLGGNESAAFGINANGQIVGYAHDAGNVPRPFLYSDGQMTDLGTLPSGVGYAYSINSAGQSVGYSDVFLGAFPSHAILFQNQTLHDLDPAHPWTSSIALGINDAGHIVGGMGGHAFLSTDGATISDLGTLGGDYSIAAGINDNDRVVGGSQIAESSAIHAFVRTTDGVLHDLGTFGGFTSYAFAINDRDQIAGYADCSGDFPSPSHAFLYDQWRMADLGTLGGLYSCANALNSLGQVVGWSSLPGDAPGAERAFLYADGLMTDLNALLPQDSGWTLSNAFGVNDRGQIVGYGTNPDGYKHAFLLSPVPEPAAVSLLLAATGIILRCRRRRLASGGSDESRRNS